MAAETARRDKLKEFLGVPGEGEGEEEEDAVREAFGETDPWGEFPNGVNHIIDGLLADQPRADLPHTGDCNRPIAGVLMGKLVAGSSLGSNERNALRLFIRLVRQDVLPLYDEALKAASTQGGGPRVSPAEEQRVLATTGMQHSEALALIMAMSVFSVVSTEDLKAMNYGMDPMHWSGFKNQVKYGNGTHLEFKKSKADPAELRQRLKKVARQLRDRGWPQASATLATFIDDLSEITFEEGAPGLFLEYYNEYMDTYRSRGLIVSQPLDSDLLRRKVLGRRNRGGCSTSSGTSSAVEDELVAMRLQMDETIKEQKKYQSQAASLRDQLTRIKERTETGAREQEQDSTYKKRPKPGEEGQRCYECGALGHFGYDCPKRKEREEREAKDKEKDQGKGEAKDKDGPSYIA